MTDPIEAAALAVWARRHPSGRVALPDGGLLRDAVYEDVRAAIAAYHDAGLAALRAQVADCQSVVRARGHAEDCPASSSACAICGLLELLHPCVTYFGDGQNHEFRRCHCSDACGHDRTTGEKALRADADRLDWESIGDQIMTKQEYEATIAELREQLKNALVDQNDHDAVVRALNLDDESTPPAEEVKRILRENDDLRERLGDVRLTLWEQEQIEKEFADLEARCAELKSALNDAIESIEDWAGYASEYFRQKHGLAEEVARLKALAEGGEHE